MCQLQLSLPPMVAATERENDGLLQRVNARLTIDLHPSKLSSVHQGVQEFLNGLLLQYSEDFEGVPLAYSNERLLSQTAVVNPYFPFVRLDVSAQLVVFAPKPGSRVVGVVSEVGEDHIGLIVLGFMNAVIFAVQVRPELRHLPAESCWRSSKTPAHRIAMGDTVAFTVDVLQQDGPYVKLVGGLQRKGTGNVAHVAQAGEQRAGGGKKKRKDRASKTAEQWQPEVGKKWSKGKADRERGHAAQPAAAGEGLGANGAAPGRPAPAHQQHAIAAAPEASKQDAGGKKKRKKLASQSSAEQQPGGGGGCGGGEARQEAEGERKKKKKKLSRP